MSHPGSTLQRKSHLCLPFLEIVLLQSQFPHSCVCEQLYISRIGPYISVQQKAERSWKYINFSQIYECRNWETERYNSVLETTVSFLGIHKWEQDIYIGFSPALHLQCIAGHTKLWWMLKTAKHSWKSPVYTRTVFGQRLFSAQKYPSEVSPTKVSAKLACVKIFYFLQSIVL